MIGTLGRGRVHLFKGLVTGKSNMLQWHVKHLAEHTAVMEYLNRKNEDIKLCVYGIQGGSRRDIRGKMNTESVKFSKFHICVSITMINLEIFQRHMRHSFFQTA